MGCFSSFISSIVETALKIFDMFFKSVASLILFLTSFLLLIAGGVVLGIGISAKVYSLEISEKFSQLPPLIKDTVDLNKIMATTTTFLVIVGSFLFLFSFLGCCGSCYRIQWMLFLYWVPLLFLISSEIAVYVYAKLYPVELEKETLRLMNASFHSYTPEVFYPNGSLVMPTEEHTLSWFTTQALLKCCGVVGPMDYEYRSWNRKYGEGFLEFNAKVPPSCCVSSPDVKDKAVLLGEILTCMFMANGTNHLIGCYEAIENEIRNSSYISNTTISLVGIVEMACLVSAIYLWCHQYQNDTDDFWDEYSE